MANIVVVSTCHQATFMSGTELYATNNPLWHPRPSEPWRTSHHHLADYMTRPMVGLYDDEDDLGEQLITVDLHFRWNFLRLWTQLIVTVSQICGRNNFAEFFQELRTVHTL